MKNDESELASQAAESLYQEANLDHAQERILQRSARAGGRDTAEGARRAATANVLLHTFRAAAEESKKDTLKGLIRAMDVFIPFGLYIGPGAYYGDGRVENRRHDAFDRGHVSFHDEIREGRPSAALLRKMWLLLGGETKETDLSPMRGFEDIWGSV
ncbi:hypothetical protein EVAR_5773_1 [Eumeta japonica]|uniref:Uncharacterized protein n=1 Tax=Eumeta variegata TaxID=151549 RepID=A0A4C1T494_EUMVA|nr:hypothetical protein EVAR_5773_1 [Eumeta japonica]